MDFSWLRRQQEQEAKIKAAQIIEAERVLESQPPRRVWVLISDCGLNGPYIHGVFTTEPSLRARDVAVNRASRTTGYQFTTVEEFYLDVPEPELS